MYGTQNRYKGVDILIEALRLLPKEMLSKSRTLIVGKTDRDIYEDYIDISDSLNIHWINKFVSDEELYKSIGNNRIADSIVRGLVGETSTVSNINRHVENKANTKAYNSHLRDFQSAYNKSYNKNILVDGLWGVQSNNAVNSIILKKNL